MWARRWVTDSDSVRGVPDGAVAAVAAAEEGGVFVVVEREREREKLSSDQQMLSRRKAALARRFPVWRRTIASSIRPRWQHALPSTKYL